VLERAALYENLFFRGLDPEEIDAIARPLERVRLLPGEVLFQQGEVGTALYLVLSGMIQIYTPRATDDLTIRTFLPGTYFGELALLGQEVRSASARAIEETTLLAVDRDVLARITSEHPVVTANIGRVLAEQLVATTQTLVHVERGELILLVVNQLPRFGNVVRYLCEAVAALRDCPVAVLAPRALVPHSINIATAVRTNQRPETQDDTNAPIYFGYRGGALLEAEALDEAARIMGDYFRRWWRCALIVVGEEERRWCEAGLPVVDRAFYVGMPDEIAGWETGEELASRPRIEAVPIVPAGRSRAEAIGTLRGAGFDRPLIYLPEREVLEAFAARGFDRRQLTDLALPHQRGLLRLARALARARVGLALGAGGARGMAHIGAMRFLEENGVPLDAIAGTSIGSLVGAAFASGFTSRRAEDHMHVWMRTGAKRLIRPAFTLKSILSGHAIEKVCHELFHDDEFVDTATPLAIVAADLVSGRSVTLREGSIATAVQASMAIPGMFPAIVIGPHVLVDGGVCEPVPSPMLGDLNADIRIVVNISFSPEDVARWTVEEGGVAPQRAVSAEKAPGIIDTYMAAFGMAVSERANTASMLADVYVRPRFLVTSWREFSQGPEHLRRGYDAAVRAHDQLHAALPWLSDA
jgi:predicted acylesterase/phospholipase RssA